MSRFAQTRSCCRSLCHFVQGMEASAGADGVAGRCGNVRLLPAGGALAQGWLGAMYGEFITN